jgi:DNA-binding response OmpR family regulator
MATALVVEDDQQLTKLLCRSLEARGIQTDSVSSGELGILQLGETRYDYLLLDIVLPGSSGFYVIDAVRALPPQRRPHVVIVTASEASKLGAIDRTLVRSVMFKPLNVEALASFVCALPHA